MRALSAPALLASTSRRRRQSRSPSSSSRSSRYAATGSRPSTNTAATCSASSSTITSAAPPMRSVPTSTRRAALAGTAVRRPEPRPPSDTPAACRLRHRLGERRPRAAGKRTVAPAWRRASRRLDLPVPLDRDGPSPVPGRGGPVGDRARPRPAAGAQDDLRRLVGGMRWPSRDRPVRRRRRARRAPLRRCPGRGARGGRVAFEEGA